MIRLLKLNGSPLTAFFNPLAEGSEIYLSGLTKDVRRRLVNLAVKKNFSQVILINPELSSALIEMVEDLAAAFVSRIFVISNENLLRSANPSPKPIDANAIRSRALYDHWPGEKTEWAVNDLIVHLPQTVICRTSEYLLPDLVAELIEQKAFRNQRDMVIVNFSAPSVLAALKLLGLPIEGLQNHPDSLERLSSLVESLAQNRAAQYAGFDRRPVFEPILEEFFKN